MTMDERLIMFRNRLQKVYRHLRKQAVKAGVSCYRVYDHDLPEFPFCIELYGDKLYVAEYKRRHGMTDSAHDDWIEKSLVIIADVLGIPKENIFLKLRQRKPGRLGQYQKYNEGQHDPTAIGFVVEENGLKFIVNLSDYLDTGLFLDHRITRQMVRQQSNGKRVLNLFAYTGSFSVYAANGGARQVITVDLSKTYLQWAERNFLLNGFQLAGIPSGFSAAQLREAGDGGIFIHADAKQYLKTIPSGYFDIIIMDPPTFSNSKRMEDILDIQRDHAEMINDCLKGLGKNGILYFSTNFRKFKMEADLIKDAVISDITKATTPFDFEGKLSRYCYKIEKKVQD